MKKTLSILFTAVFLLTAFSFPCFAEETATAAFTVDLTGIVIAAASLIFNFLLAWFAKKVVPALKTWLEKKTDAEERAAIWELIEKTVEAAEQVIGAGKGAEKLRYVKKKLYAAGYDFDEDLVEAAVKEMNDKIKETAQVAFIAETTSDEPTESDDKAETTTAE